MPTATLVHHIAGRTRFRVPAKRGDEAYFAQSSEKFEECPGVLAVTVNARTASILILHEAATDVDVLVSYAHTFELFDSTEAATAPELSARRATEIVTHRLMQLDRWVHEKTQQSTDLRSLALTGLLSAGLWQMLRGRILPEAVTLAWYAVALATISGPQPEIQRKPPQDGIRAREDEGEPVDSSVD